MRACHAYQVSWNYFVHKICMCVCFWMSSNIRKPTNIPIYGRSQKRERNVIILQKIQYFVLKLQCILHTYYTNLQMLLYKTTDCTTHRIKKCYGIKPQSVALTIRTILNCGPLKVFLHVLINMHWASLLAWSLMNNTVILTGAEPNHSNPWKIQV